MIKTIYTGQQYSNNMDISLGIVDIVVKNLDSSLSFTGIDLTKNQINLDNPAPGTGMVVSKLDMLFYHRLSITGNIMSSVVFVGGPTILTDTAEYFYKPKTLYKNSQFELGLNIPSNETNFSMLNSGILSKLEVGSGKHIIFKFPEKNLSLTGYPSPIIGRDIIAKDGWYSIVSVGLSDTGVSAGLVKKGMLVQDDSSTIEGTKPWYARVYCARIDGANPTELSDATQWDLMSDWPRSVVNFQNPINIVTSLADVIGNLFPYNPWVRKDLFWLANYDKVYRDAVIGYVEGNPTFTELYPSLRAIHSSVDYYATRNKFDEAQLLLQGTDIYMSYHNFSNHV